MPKLKPILKKSTRKLKPANKKEKHLIVHFGPAVTQDGKIIPRRCATRLGKSEVPDDVCIVKPPKRLR